MCKRFLLLALICTSCGASKVATSTDMQRDSISVVIKESVIYKDTIVYVEVPVEVNKSLLPDTDTSHLETSLAISEAWVNAGRLNHTLKHKENASISQIIPIPEKQTSKDSVIISIKEVVKEVPIEVEMQPTWWQQLRMTIGTLTLLYLALWMGFKLLKTYLQF